VSYAISEDHTPDGVRCEIRLVYDALVTYTISEYHTPDGVRCEVQLVCVTLSLVSTCARITKDVRSMECVSLLLLNPYTYVMDH
jgi:hypothetical protein